MKRFAGRVICGMEAIAANYAAWHWLHLHWVLH